MPEKEPKLSLRTVWIGTVPTGDWRTERPVVDRAKCTKCRICVDFCPEPAILWTNGQPEWDLNFCKGCGICANECPVKAITMVREE